MAAALAFSQAEAQARPRPTLVVSAYIPAGEAKELRWYFGTGGTDVFAVSPFEAQLQRMRLFSRAKRCRKCRGEGFVPLNPKRWVKTTELEREQQAWLGQKPRWLVSPRSRGVSLSASGVCRSCHGIGWVESARRPTKNRPANVRTRCVRGSDRWGSVPLGGGGVAVSDVDVVRLAQLERRLTAVRRVEDVLFRALAAYYEPSGAKMRALWELVPSGKTLLRRGDRLEGLPALVHFANVCRAQSEKPDPNVAALIQACDEQATELLSRAVEAWNQTASLGERNR